VKVLIDAFEDTLRALRLHDREDPLTMAVAKIIIELAKDGERDPTRLRDLALKAVSGTKPSEIVANKQFWFAPYKQPLRTV
jgi:hypothetical protein